MLDIALNFIKSTISEHLRLRLGASDAVEFQSDHQPTERSFPLGKITLLLANLEEEKIMRQADPYHSTTSSGQTGQVQPEIRLNLYILFVARFEHYEHSMTYLSWVLQFFQKNRVLDQKKFPALSKEIGQLAVELVTQNFTEQASLWRSLDSAQHPSLLFKVKMLRFTDGTVNTLATRVMDPAPTTTSHP